MGELDDLSVIML